MKPLNTILFSMLCIATVLPVGAVAADKPNVIFFIADDMYTEMFNCLPDGRGENLTPNLDRLAEEGTVLLNQYVVSPLCTPSRYNCLTGRFASRATNEKFVTQTKNEGGQTVIQWNTFITASDKSLPGYLRNAGYKTGMVGKNHVYEVGGLEHFDDYWDDPRKPENARKLESNYQKTRQAILDAGFDFAESIYFDNPSYIGLGQLAVQNMEWIAQGGIDFIDRYKDDPFFLYFATTVPHAPSDAERSWKADPLATAYGFMDKAPNVMPPRDTLEPRLKEAGVEGYGKELVLWMDDALGALLDRLEKHGLIDNTIIFFFNDHGQRAKGHLYQGGILNPSLVWRSKGFTCGSSSHAKIQNIDFSPTILDFAGVELPDGTFDGKSFKPVLDGEKEEVHDSLFFELGYARGIIKGDYKYMAIRYPEYAENMSMEERTRTLAAYNETRFRMKAEPANYDPAAPFSHFSTVPGGQTAENESYGRTEAYFDSDQLYNLKMDPKEMKNLAGRPENEALLKQMKAELKNYLVELPGSFGDLKTTD
ncbi:sulfatase family protein [Pontiella sulfatireligans]|uniref:Arylsulfatase n=1 Tax=Pontiella sulfatireligans TaxID=2750658 RepID=A0A6C2UER1_9BACT|nr:sulfatase-like hydrolase/transferase [Pontiella sulfatireligans]SPS74211.1 sulfatase S1_51 [Kiritimatiellales bacterium]VGO18645.1 Arylsulfatase [Pontiella sulfatireligans]